VKFNRDFGRRKFLTLPINILRSFGVNRAIGFGILTRMWGALAGPITILLIATRFSRVEQGYYYTFGSLLALQVFFELGLLTVLAQFAAHEFAFLSWGEKGEITGSEAHRDRFVDLLGKGFKWYSISAMLLIPVLILVGFLFFTQSPAVDFSWRLPWALAVIGVGCNILLIPFYAVITGSGEVASINRREMMGGMAGSIVGWLVIACGGGLYAIPAVTTGTIVVGVAYLFKSKPKLVKTAFSCAFGSRVSSHTISWRGEVWPMQWKIAISWVSGYFIFQLFTPVLFKFYGPVVAGQMGMTLSAVNAVQGICLMWLQTRSPELGKLIASKNWKGLDQSFNQVLKQAITVCIITAAVAIIVIAGLQSYTSMGTRFLPVLQVMIFLVAVCGNVVISGWAIYMRAHKQEPMMLISIISAILIGTSTLILGVKYSSIGMVIGYCLITLLYGIPSTYFCLGRFKTTNQIS
jgi:O-antigen/teichoic acid export membrane protein